MFCLRCGKEIPKDAKFCMGCGEEIVVDVQENKEEPKIQQEYLATDNVRSKINSLASQKYWPMMFMVWLALYSIYLFGGICNQYSWSAGYCVIDSIFTVILVVYYLYIDYLLYISDKSVETHIGIAIFASWFADVVVHLISGYSFWSFIKLTVCSYKLGLLIFYFIYLNMKKQD